jgi:hypothetical protein
MNSENSYNSVCRKDIPYPSVSNESVPSLVENLTTALYGPNLTKTVVGGRVIWTIPCDPNNTATIFQIPRLPNEGLLCYFIRALRAGAPAATNLLGGSAGQVPYQSAPNTTLFTATGVSGQVLTSGGTAAPTWSTLLNPIAAALIFG